MTHYPRPRRHLQWTLLAAFFLVTAVLLAIPPVFSQTTGKADSGAALRKDPQYAQLVHDAKAFYALQPTTQEAMRQLYDDLEKLAPAEREWLKDVLKRYSDWLDKLPEADRQRVVREPNLQARLQIIKELRDKQWFARLPRAIRLYVEKLPKAKPSPAVTAASIIGLALGPPRTMRPLTTLITAATQMTDWQPEAIKRLKSEEARKARDWVIATRHWTQLTNVNPNIRTMQTRPAEFGPSIETFIREFLMPVLSEAEQAKLKAAEGKWPLYPLTLVDLADKHPLALPPALGPKLMADLPTEVRKNVLLAYTKSAPKEGKKKQDPDKFFHNLKNPQLYSGFEERVKGLSASAKFAAAVATWAHSKNVKLPPEFWPIRASDMSVPMRVFLDQQGPFWGRLTPKEREQLNASQGKWPEYPLKIQELANQHGMPPPWLTLPEIADKGDIWDKYRIKPRNKLETPPPPLLKGKGKGGIGKDKEEAGLVWQQPSPRRILTRDVSVQALAGTLILTTARLI